MSLKALLNILIRRWYIIVLCLLSTSVAAITVLRTIPPRFEGKATVVVDPGQIDPATGVIGSTGTRAAMNNLIAVANSQRLAEDVFDKLGLENEPNLAAQYRQSKSYGRLTLKEWGAKQLAGGIEAQAIPEGSNIIVFTYKSTNSLEAASYANLFANSFVELAVDMKRSGAQQASQWLDPQIDKLKANLAVAQTDLSNYRKSANLLPTSAGPDSDASLLSAITSQLAQTKADALKVETLLAAKDLDNASLAEQAASPLLDSLRGQLVSVKSDLARVQSDVGEHNAKVVSLNAAKLALQQAIQAEQLQIRRRLVDRLSNYNQQIAFLQRQQATQTTVMIQQQSKIDQMNDLARQVSIDQDQMNVSLRTAATSKLQSQASYSAVSLLDPAITPETPSFPKKFPILAAAVGGGLMLGMVFALLGEILDRKIRTLEDLAFATQIHQSTALTTV